MKSPLPVPEFIEEDECSFTFKQPRGNNEALHLRRPPKLHQTINRSLNASLVNLISFRQGSGQSELSTIYDQSNPETYYEQCFEQLTKVGEGSFGEVFKVRSRADGRLYAVKKSKTYFRSSQSRQNCLEEVRQYEQFSDHENCVKLHQAWEQDDRLYMQMELCRENLEVYAREQQQLADERIWSILLDLLLALKSLHDRNLIHLDIKLDNILVTDDGTCKLADFGLVFDLSKGNTRNAREGDSRYLAPELMAGRYTKAADIFSLGIATLELTCNLELPRNGRMWQRLRSGQPLPDNLERKISQPLREIIAQMMKAQPEERPTVDALLQHPIIRKLHESRRRQRIMGRLRSYFFRKLSSLWRFVMTAVLWFTGCLRLQHRKHPAGEAGIDANHSTKDHTRHMSSCRKNMNSIPITGTARKGVSRSIQDQAYRLISDEEDLLDNSMEFERSPCHTSTESNLKRKNGAQGEGNDENSSDLSGLQITPTLNNSIPSFSPTFRLVNSTPLNPHQLHNLQNGVHLQHSRNGSRYTSRLICSPPRFLWFDEEDLLASDASYQGVAQRNETPLNQQSPIGRFNDSDSDIRPLGSSPSATNVHDSLENNSHPSVLDIREQSISSTPICSLNRVTGASSASVGCDTPPSGYSSFLIKKKLCFNDENENDSE